MERYPTVDGVGVNPFELRLPASHLDLGREQNWNNHHNGWEARAFGSLALFQIFRDLERHQFLMPIDQHADLHRIYSPPKMPTVLEAMNVVVDAYDSSERLRVGSARNPEYKAIGLDTLQRATRDYNNRRAA